MSFARPEGPRAARVAALVAVVAFGSVARAQCGFQWQPGPGWPGPNGSVLALANAANGELLAGGTFTVADSAVVQHVARWNGSAWTGLGGGVDGDVHALTVLANGDVVAGGAFTLAGGVPANRIARWNGSGWAPLGTGLDGHVWAQLLLPTGDLVVGGSFTTAGGAAAPGVALWDGVAWHAIGGGLQGTVRALARTSTGALFAGGVFGADGLARWNGTAWSAIPGVGADVYELAVLGNGDVVIGGWFWLSAHPSQVDLARWDGVHAIAFPSPLYGTVTALSVASNGDLVAGGHGVPANVARWSGGTWTSLGGGTPRTVHELIHDPSGVVVAGCATGEAPPPQPAVARWNGAWTPVGAAVPPVAVACTARARDGTVYVGGAFAGLGGTAARNVARWTGSGWLPLGAGVDGPVSALAVAGNGDLVVGGNFASAGGAPAGQLARWNGFAWSTVGAGLGEAPTALAATASGEVFAITGYGTQLRRFDGSGWSSVPLPGWPARALAAEPDGSVLIGGDFLPFNGLLRWSAGVLDYVTGAPPSIRALLVTGDGALVVATTTTNARVVRRHGTAWSTIGQAPAGEPGPYALGELPNGDLLIAGDFTQIGALAARGLARWDGTAWHGFAATPEGGVPVTIAASAAGEVLIGGTFAWIGSAVQAGFARATPVCAASAVTFGAGCTGSAGPVALQPASLPWTGGGFRATASGLPPLALGVHAVGLPLPAAPLPLAPSGCWWFVDPILLDLVLPNGATATVVFPVPRDASLVGQLVHTQLAVVERDASLALRRLLSSNALQLTIGAF